MTTAFVQAAMILLREGLEAMLVISALAAYLDKAGARSRLPPLYGGALLAVLASLATAWVFAKFNNGEHDDVVEGVVMLAAAALMLYVSGWLFIRQDPRAWQSMLKAKADAALSRQTMFAIAALAFLAVFREGAETVLFIHALAQSEGGYSLALFAGLIAATVGLVALFFVINGLARRVPLRPLFLATSAFLFLMALKFIGGALHEFQEQQLIGYYEVPKLGPWLEAIGFNPTLQAVALQLAIILLAVFTFLMLERRGRRSVAAG